MADPAYAAALKLLARRDYFRQELATRLQRKEFSADEIETALARCADSWLACSTVARFQQRIKFAAIQPNPLTLRTTVEDHFGIVGTADTKQVDMISRALCFSQVQIITMFRSH